MEYSKRDFAAEFDIKEIQPDGTFTGFASTFGGKKDAYGDIVVAGAFKETINKNGWGGNGIKMLWQHDSADPIGIWLSLSEEKKGLRVQGQIATKTSRGSDAYELMKIGAINSMSIGYNVVDYEVIKEKNGDQTRLLKTVDLLEISLVTFPANTNAVITGVKDITVDDLVGVKDIRQAEQFLRDVGFSAKASKYLISALKGRICDDRDETSIIDTLKGCKDQLKKLLEEK